MDYFELAVNPNIIHLFLAGCMLKHFFSAKFAEGRKILLEALELAKKVKSPPS